MRRGILGVPEPDSLGAADGITGVEDEVRTTTYDGPGVDELTAAVNVQEQKTLTGGNSVYVGKAMRERVAEEDSYHVEDGVIKERTTVDSLVQDFTRFAAVPASENHDGFMLVSSSSGLFAFGLVSAQNTGRLRTANLRLGSFYRDREDTFTPTTSGGAIGGFKAQKMTAWGDDVLDDENVGDLLDDPVRTNLLNQLAGEYIYEVAGTGIPFKVNMANSGYVEVWDPSDLTTPQFIKWVRTEVLPYAEVVEDEDDDSEQTTLGNEDQHTDDADGGE